MKKRSEPVKRFFRYLKDAGMKVETLDASYGIYAFEYRTVELYVSTSEDDDVITLASKYFMRGMPSDKEFNFNQMLKVLPGDYSDYEIELLPYGDCCMSRARRFDIEKNDTPDKLFKNMLDDMVNATFGLISAIRSTEKKYDYY